MIWNMAMLSVQDLSWRKPACSSRRVSSRAFALYLFYTFCICYFWIAVLLQCLWLTSLCWWKHIGALTNCSSAWLLMALISCWKVSCGMTFAFALYWSDFGQVFCSKCLSSLSMKFLVFYFLNAKVLMVSSCFVFLGCCLDWLLLGRFSCSRCLPL